MTRRYCLGRMETYEEQLTHETRRRVAAQASADRYDAIPGDVIDLESFCVSASGDASWTQNA